MTKLKGVILEHIDKRKAIWDDQRPDILNYVVSVVDENLKPTGEMAIWKNYEVKVIGFVN